MEDKRKDMIEDNEIDYLLQQLYGFSDEQLLRDFKEMEADNTPRPELEPFPDEFDRIWEDIQAERAARLAEEGKEVQPKEAATVTQMPRRRKLKWKRLAAVGLAACFLTLGFCFVAVGKKSYFFRERNRADNSLVFNNDSLNYVNDSEEEAYAMIASSFGIKPLKLNYKPNNFIFKDIEIKNDKAIMQFSFNDNIVYFVQAKRLKESSDGYKSDGVALSTVTNKWLNEELVINRENLEEGKGKPALEVQFQYKEMYCWLFGIMEQSDFEKIVETISY